MKCSFNQTFLLGFQQIVSVGTPACIQEDNESENEDAADNNEPLTTAAGNIATSTGNSRRKKRSKKMKNR